MKKRKFRFNKFFRLIILVILIISILFLFNKYFLSKTNTSKTIFLSHNDLYSGIGQEFVYGNDGYFSTFTTIDNHKKVYKEYKQNGSSSWASHSYWGGTMEENGCGITALSIIISGYNGNVTPEDLRKKYYPVLDGENFSNVLKKSFGINNSDFLYSDNYFKNEYIIDWLKTNRPILVCVWNKPHDNRWTTASHYLVLLACSDDNKVYVSNPNGGKNDSKSSGWYDINEITPFIAKILFIEDY